MQDPSAVTTFLFTDIEGSTRLWEDAPERMRPALAHHDALARAAVEGNHGTVVKMTGDGMYAVFDDPVDALDASVALQRSLADPTATNGVRLRVRCGLHAGVVEQRDHDFFGAAVNRAARIMGAAHGGQVLLSKAVAALVADRLPPGMALRDLGSVRLRDLASPEHVCQLVHPELRQEFPVLRSLEATPNNLPQQMTSFVGRERELADVRTLLRKSRLLTLLGVGGLGKTRLSLQVAADVLDDYPDGVWFVELAPLTDGERVPQVVASVLGVKEEAGHPVQEALVKYVKDVQLLLVLDNCEHLLQACADLAVALLHAGPAVKVLASSREPLHVAGETNYPLPSLAVPAADRKLAAAALAQYEAVRLFTDRAVAAKPAFQVTDQNAAAVTAICLHLDGIPLALELAAARVRALSVEQIAERLDGRFHLLTGGDRTALPRQQTLRACIDWSYDLLSEPERALFRRLAVFAGGWTLEAAEAVGPGEGIDEADVFDLLTHLVDKSLVTLENEGERYGLLETVRQYAQERLDASGEGDGIRAQHLRFYLDYAEEARSHLFGPEEAIWLRRLDLERQNLLSAHAWCARARDGAALDLRLVSAVKPYWLSRGLLTLGFQVTGEALARAGAQAHSVARCRGLFDAGQLCLFMGRYEEARQLLTESLVVARGIGDKTRIAAALQPLGTAFLGLGNYAAARTHLEEAFTLARDLDDKRRLAGALNALGQLNRMEGALEIAEPFYEQMLVLARELGEPGLIAIGLLNLAMVAVGRGEGDRVRTLLLEVLEIARETGSKPAGQSALEVSAGLAVNQGDFQRAARFFGAAEAQTRQTNLHRDPADEMFLRPLVAQARAALGSEAFAAAEAAGGAVAYEDAIDEAGTWLSASD